MTSLLRSGVVVLVLSFGPGFSALAQDATAPVKQVPAGSTATIGPAKPAAAATPTSPQGKMLDSALTPETRKALQDAMDSTPAK